MSLAQYKLFKKTSDEDKDRGLANGHKAGLAGAAAAVIAGRGKPAAPGAGALGKALVKVRGTRLRRGVAGYIAGTAAVQGVRVATEGTKDVYGDRSRGAKHAEKVPIYAGLAGAGLLLRQRLKEVPRRFSVPVQFGAAQKIEEGVGNVGAGTVLGAARRIFAKSIVPVGEIAAGDLIGEKVYHAWQDDKDAKKKKPGVTQPIATGQSFAARYPRMIAFSREQLRGNKGVYVDPLQAASGEVHAVKPVLTSSGQYQRHEDGTIVTTRHHVGVTNAQVIRSAYGKAKDIQRVGRRGLALGKDAVGALQGKAKVDERGRPMKREWEKAWFKNAAGAAVVAGGLLTHAHVMKKNPAYRAKVVKAKNYVKAKVNKVVPDAFPHYNAADLAKQILFDAWAEEKGWDVRDPRGRSARVFAPGSRRRERREKKWGERVDNIRKLAVIGGVGALAVGGAAGFLIGRRHPHIPIRPRKPGKVGESVKPETVIRVDDFRKHSA